MARAGLPSSFVLGLAGGVGSGKSLVAGLLKRKGGEILDADVLGHRALERPEIIRRLVRAWGPGILREGAVDRPALARAAFRSKTSVRRLNRIVHPAILGEIRRRLETARTWTVLDAALLFEVGAEKLCDRVVYVDAPRRQRERRIRSRGWPTGELERRERFQWTPAYKKKKADYVINNTGTPSRTERQLERILDDLRRNL